MLIYEYVNYYLQVSTDNGDVLALRYPTEITFNEEGNVIDINILECYDSYFDKSGILSTYAYIKNSNIKSHNYVKSLGYKQDESKNNGEFYYYTLNKDDYIAKRYRYLSIT